MNLARHMEVVFVLVLAGLIAQGMTAMHATPVNAALASFSVNHAGIAVVTVTAKRLSPM